MALWKDAIDAVKAGKKEEAKHLFLDLSKQNPNSERVYHWLAFLTDALPDKACYLRKVLKLNPDNDQARQALVKVLFTQGVQAARQKIRAVAHQLFLEITQLDHHNEKAWLWLASVSESISDRSRYLHKVIDINPKNEKARTWLQKLGTIDEQKKNWYCPFCLQGHTQKPKNCPHCKAMLTLAQFEEDTKPRGINQDLLEAAVDRLKIRTVRGNAFSDHYHLGLAYCNLGQFKWGLAVLDRAAKMRPEDEELHAAINGLRAILDRNTEDTLPNAPPRVNKGTVMVIDDSSTVRKLVAITLERHGYQVVSAESGIQALARINELLPDLIFLDIKMPNLNGYQICKIIKENELTKKIPVIMLSGQDGFFNRVRGRSVGAEEFITKPFESSTLIDVLEKHCHR